MQDFKNNTGYLEQLKRRRKVIQRQKDTILNQPTLQERIEMWFAGLSQEDQKRAWHMREFRAIFEESPQRLGAALFDLKWIRRRSWADSRPTARYWLKE